MRQSQHLLPSIQLVDRFYLQLLDGLGNGGLLALACSSAEPALEGMEDCAGRLSRVQIGKDKFVESRETVVVMDPLLTGALDGL